MAVGSWLALAIFVLFGAVECIHYTDTNGDTLIMNDLKVQHAVHSDDVHAGQVYAQDVHSQGTNFSSLLRRVAELEQAVANLQAKNPPTVEDIEGSPMRVTFDRFVAQTQMEPTDPHSYRFRVPGKHFAGELFVKYSKTQTYFWRTLTYDPNGHVTWYSSISNPPYMTSTLYDHGTPGSQQPIPQPQYAPSNPGDGYWAQWRIKMDPAIIAQHSLQETNVTIVLSGVWLPDE